MRDTMRKTEIQTFLWIAGCTTIAALLFLWIGTRIPSESVYDPATVPDPFFIFRSNLLLQMGVILSGLFSIGLAPLFYIAFHFLMLGSTVQAVAKETSLSFAWSLVWPHGLIEIPGMICSAAISFFLLPVLYRRVRYKEPVPLRFVAKLISLNVLMIGIAALVETYITPQVVRLFV